MVSKTNKASDTNGARKRIGIYAGTFNPVHTGHVTFALQAIEAANLDMVYFLPERRPRAKQTVEHFAHRVAMLNRAVAPHPKLGVVELVDINFSVKRTVPELQQLFGTDAEFVYLFGSDVAPSLPSWPDAASLLKKSELIVGVRSQDNLADIKTMISGWELQPKAVTIFDSYAPTVSSALIREALRRREPTSGLLTSVERYSNRHWLYVSLA